MTSTVALVEDVREVARERIAPGAVRSIASARSRSRRSSAGRARRARADGAGGLGRRGRRPRRAGRGVRGGRGGVRLDRDGLPDALGHRRDDRGRRRRACGRVPRGARGRAGCSARSPSASAAPARTSTRRSCRPSATNGGVRISGRKSFVTSGGHADLYLVLVQSGERRGARLLRGRRASDGRHLRRRRGRAWAWPATRASRWSSIDVVE